MRVLLRSALPPARLPGRLFATRAPVELQRNPTATEEAFRSTITNAGSSNEKELPPLQDRVGIREDSRYTCLETVPRWRNHDVDGSAKRIANILREDSSSWSYFAYHGFRATAFAGQGMLSILLAAAVSSLSRSNGPQAAGYMSSSVRGIPTAARSLGSEVVGVLADDYANIKAGIYKAPWDMSLRHRQLSPSYVAGRSAAYFQEALDTLQRRSRSGVKGAVDTKNWLKSPMHPGYYSDSFHFQTDGWMSKNSADIYEVSTETLFLGRQDAMQRTALVSIQRWRANGNDGGVDGKDLRVAEFACGTGRFSTFVRDNMPAADFTLLDLSPFYLAKARENHQYYESYTGKDKVTGKVDFIHAQAEDSGLASDSFDVTYCVYAFHEMPTEARAAVAKEMVRVTRPGGIIVLTDSGQLGDRPEMDTTIGNFEAFNEPYYRSFIADDLGAHFEAAGAKAHEKVVASVTKSLSFIKQQ